MTSDYFWNDFEPVPSDKKAADVGRFEELLDRIEDWLFDTDILATDKSDLFTKFFNAIIYIEKSQLDNMSFKNACIEKLFIFLHLIMNKERINDVLNIAIHWYECGTERVELITLSILNEMLTQQRGQMNQQILSNTQCLPQVVNKKLNNYVGKMSDTDQPQESIFYDTVMQPYKADVLLEMAKLIFNLTEFTGGTFPHKLFADVIETTVLSLEEPLPQATTFNFRVRIQLYQAFCKFAIVFIKANDKDVTKSQKVKAIHEKFLGYVNDSFTYPRELLTDTVNSNADYLIFLQKVKESLQDINIQPNSRLLVTFNRLLELLAKKNPQNFTSSKITSMYELSWSIIPSHRLGIHNTIHAIKFIKHVFENINHHKNIASEVSQKMEFTLTQCRQLLEHLTTVIKLMTFYSNPLEQIKHFFWNTTSRNTLRIIDNLFEVLKPVYDLFAPIVDSFTSQNDDMNALLYEFFKHVIHFTIMKTHGDDPHILIPSMQQFDSNCVSDALKRILKKIHDNNNPDNERQYLVVRKSIRYLLKRALELDSVHANKLLALYDDFLVFMNCKVVNETFSLFCSFIYRGENLNSVASLFKKVCIKIKSFIDPTGFVTDKSSLIDIKLGDYQFTIIQIVGICYKMISKYLTKQIDEDVNPYTTILEGCFILHPLEVISCLKETKTTLFKKIFLDNPISELPFFYLSEYLSSLTDASSFSKLPTTLLDIADVCLRLPLPINSLTRLLYIGLPIASTVVCCSSSSESLKSAAHRYLAVVCNVFPPVILYRFIPSVDKLKIALANIISSTNKSIIDFPKHENQVTKQNPFYAEEPLTTSLIKSLASLASLPSDSPTKTHDPIDIVMNFQQISFPVDLTPFCENYIDLLKDKNVHPSTYLSVLIHAVSQKVYPSLARLYFLTVSSLHENDKNRAISVKEIRSLLKKDVKNTLEGFVLYLEYGNVFGVDGFDDACKEVIEIINECGGLEENRDAISNMMIVLSQHEQSVPFDFHVLQFMKKCSLKHPDLFVFDSPISVRYLFDVTQREYYDARIDALLDSLLSPTCLDAIIQTIDDSLPRWLHDLFISVISSNSPKGSKYIMNFFKANPNHPEISILLEFQIDPTNPNFNEIIKYQIDILSFVAKSFSNMPSFREKIQTLLKEKIQTLLKIKIPRQHLIIVTKEEYCKFVITSLQNRDVNVAPYFFSITIKLMSTDCVGIINQLIETIEYKNLLVWQRPYLFEFLYKYSTTNEMRSEVTKLINDAINETKKHINDHEYIHQFIHQLHSFFQLTYTIGGIDRVLTELLEFKEYCSSLCIISILKQILNSNALEAADKILAQREKSPLLLEILASLPQLQLFDSIFQQLLTNEKSVWLTENGPISLLPFLIKYTKKKRLPEDIVIAIINLSNNKNITDFKIRKTYTTLLLQILRYRTDDPELIRLTLAPLETGDVEKYHFVMLYYIRQFPKYVDKNTILSTMRAINTAIKSGDRLLVYALQYVVTPLIREHTKLFENDVLLELKTLLTFNPSTNNVTVFDEVQGTQLHVFIETVQMNKSLLENLRDVALDNNISPSSLHNTCLKLHAQLLAFTPNCKLQLTDLLEQLLTLPINEIYFNSISIGNIEIETIAHYFHSSPEEQEKFCKIILRHINSPYQENVLPFTFPVKYFYVFFKRRNLFISTILRSINHFETRNESTKCIDLCELIVNWEKFRMKEPGIRPLCDNPTLNEIMQKSLKEEVDNKSLFEKCGEIVQRNLKKQAQAYAQTKNKPTASKLTIKRCYDNFESILSIWGSEAKSTNKLLTYNDIHEVARDDSNVLKQFLVAAAKSKTPVLYDEGIGIISSDTESDELYVPLVSGYLKDSKNRNEMSKKLTNFVQNHLFVCVKEYIPYKQIYFNNPFFKDLTKAFDNILNEIKETPSSMSRTPPCEKLLHILDILFQSRSAETNNLIHNLGIKLFETLGNKDLIGGEKKLVAKCIEIFGSAGCLGDNTLLTLMGEYFVDASKHNLKEEKKLFLSQIANNNVFPVIVRTVGLEEEDTRDEYLKRFVSHLESTQPGLLFQEIIKKEIPNKYHTNKWIMIFIQAFFMKLGCDVPLSLMNQQVVAERLFVGVVSSLFEGNKEAMVKIISYVYEERKKTQFGVEGVLLEVICKNNIDVGDLCLWDSNALMNYGKSISFLKENFIRERKPKLLSQLYDFVIGDTTEKYHTLAFLMNNSQLKNCMLQYPRNAESLHNIVKELLIDMQNKNDAELEFASDLKIDLALLLNLTTPLRKYGEVALRMCKTDDRKRKLNDLVSTCVFRETQGEKESITHGDECLHLVHSLCSKLTLERGDRSAFNSTFDKELHNLISVFEKKIQCSDINNFSVLSNICHLAVLVSELIEIEFFMFFYYNNNGLEQIIDKISSLSSLFTLDCSTKDLYIVRRYALDHHRHFFQKANGKKTQNPGFNAITSSLKRLEILNQIEYARYHRRVGLYSPAILLLEDVQKSLTEDYGTTKTQSPSEKTLDEPSSLFVRISLEKGLNADALERPLQMVEIMQSTYDNFIQPVLDTNNKNTEEVNMFFKTLKVLHPPTIE
ncbi:Non-specific serine/threonine protein kinase [Entamoeba marina]